MSDRNYLQEIDNFEAHYKYDSTYMRELLETSPLGYEKFANFMPMASHIEKLTPQDYWVAKLAAMQVEDCGACLQLNIRMAIEAGITKDIIEAALQGGSDLPEELRDVYHYARDVAEHNLHDSELMARIESRFDKGQLLEFGLCIAAAKVFPTIKRCLGYSKSCSLMEITV